MTEESPLFLRLRIVAFNCVNLFSFLWVILDSIVIFSQWNYMNEHERSLVSVMLLVNVITVVTLLILLLVQFRAWLDVARICFLVLAQTGSAGAFAYWKLQFDCEEQSGDEQGVCDIFATGILVTSWIVPGFLLLYLAGLAYRSFRYRVRRAGTPFDAESSNPLPEDIYQKNPHLSTVFPAPVAFPSDAYNRQSVNVNGRRFTMSTTTSKVPSLHNNPGRLSKQSPLACYL